VHQAQLVEHDMEVVKMITSLAGEELFVGECHPARARILVKKEMASWKDGKLLLHILGIHNAFLQTNPDAIRGPLDDGNVSLQEIERRIAWFKTLVPRVSMAYSEGSRWVLPSLEEVANAPKAEPVSDPSEVQHVDFDADKVDSYFLDEGDPRRVDVTTEDVFVELGPQVPLPPDLMGLWELGPEVGVEQGQTSGAVPPVQEGDETEPDLSLDDLWEPVPNLERIFGVASYAQRDVITSREAYEAIKEQDRQALLAANQHVKYLRQGVSLLGDEVPVATMGQIRLMKSRMHEASR